MPLSYIPQLETTTERSEIDEHSILNNESNYADFTDYAHLSDPFLQISNTPQRAGRRRTMTTQFAGSIVALGPKAIPA